MGLEFLGNPYENSNDGDSDVEIERDELGDEEWVVPQNFLANRLLIQPIDFWPSDEGSDFSLELDDEDDEDFIPEDSLWDEDSIGADDSNVDNHDDTEHDDTDHDDENDDDDVFQNPDNENYPECDEINDLFDQHSSATYGVNENDFSDDDCELDYVTYPIENPKPPEQPDKTTSKNTDANNINSNSSESGANSTSHTPPDD